MKNIFLGFLILFFCIHCAPSALGPGPRTTESVLAEINPTREAAIKHEFKKAKVAYPPQETSFLFFKKERRMELWAHDTTGPWTFIRNYKILAASGMAGPKLKQGDMQVPEGIYSIEFLHPNSNYHLAMKVNYPNSFDQEKAHRERRVNCGGDIFIHGQRGSSGCLAMGNINIESLFTIAARTGIEHTKVIIAPNDLRHAPPITSPKSEDIPWLGELYEKLIQELSVYK